MKRFVSIIVIMALLLSGCGGKKDKGMKEVEYTTESEETGWIYLPDSMEDDPERERPLVLMLCAPGTSPSDKLKAAGWWKQAQEADLLILMPKYRTTESYSQTDRLMESVNYAIENYPVDTTRIYATGFSNGGGAVTALVNDYPQTFAAISCMSWMMPIKHLSSPYEMPFQIIRGSEDLTLEMDSGAMRVIDDEVWGIEALMRYNHLLEHGEAKDFDKTEYWGYEPDEVKTSEIDGRTWTFSNHYKEGYTRPFGQMILIDGGKHELNEDEAFVAWDFLRHYTRAQDGAVIEVE